MSDDSGHVASGARYADTYALRGTSVSSAHVKGTHMTITRRQLLSRGTAAGAVLALSRRAFPFAQSPTNIRKFVVTLPGLGPAGGDNIGNYIPPATKTSREC